jgi:hypothetical protein
VPHPTATAQPDPELVPPSPGGKHHVNGSDRVSGTYRLAKIRWRIEHDYRELKTGLALDHFEGRSFTGWHRHVTRAILAQAFCTLLRADPKAPSPG